MSSPIHICMAVRDECGCYCKYAGVAIASILEHTTADVVLHLMHDWTLAERDRKRFEQLAAAYGQQIVFYEIDAEKEFLHLSQLKTVPIITIGTLFRLKMPELLDSSVHQVLYMDTDTLTNLDIAELWNLSIGTCLGAGRQEPDHPFFHQHDLFVSGIIPLCGYINAGVVLWNLKEIRAAYPNFFENAMEFFRRYPDVPLADSDAMNYFFRGRTKVIEDFYNYLTIFHRGHQEMLRPAIYHFAGDHPYASCVESFDQLFFETLLRTPWGKPKELVAYFSHQICRREEQVLLVRRVAALCKNRKQVFWGAKSVLCNRALPHFPLDVSRDYFVDSNPALQGSTVHGLIVKSPDALLVEAKEDVVIFVLSQMAYPEIRKHLADMGFEERKNFFDIRWLLLENEGGAYEL